MTEEQAKNITQPNPQTPKNKKGMSENQKSWLTFGAIGVIAVAGGAYLLLLGSAQEDVAKQVALEVKALEGKGYQEKMVALTKKEFMPQLDGKAAKVFDEMFSSIGGETKFSEINEFADDKFGGVKIDNVTMTSTMGDTKLGDTVYKDVVIKKTVEEPNKYYYSGGLSETKQLDPISNQAAMITKMDGYDGYFEFNSNGGFKGTEGNIKKMSFTDGSGAMTYASIDNMYSKFITTSTPETSNIQTVIRIEKITTGETIKMMLGDLKPLSVNIDFSYNGDPIAKLEKISKENPDLSKHLKSDPVTALAAVGAADKFSGQVKLNDFAIMSGEMGVTTNADLTFAAFPYQPMPKGALNFTIKNYNDIITYARNFMPIAQEEVDAELFKAKEYFTDNGKDLVFSANFDGTRIVKLGTGKEIDVVEEYKKSTAPAELAPVAEENKFETEIKSEANPVSVPQVQQRELGKP